MGRERDYIYYDSTISICPICLKRINAKIILKENSVFLLKNCKEHGEQMKILEEVADFWLKRRDYDKPGTSCKTQTKLNLGCPFDCGLCTEHDQHTCIGLIDVCMGCNLNCPICYAGSSKIRFLKLDKINKMLDFYQDSEYGKAEVLQISGGEPTLHPEIIKIIQLAREKKIKYVMLNTNGLRLAQDEEFVKELSQFRGGFEIYLQFDGFSKRAYQKLRGRDLKGIKLRAISNLRKYQIPVTLVATIEKNTNDKEIGKIIEFAMGQEYIRGVNFQPIAFFGKAKEKQTKDRVTLTGILKRIEEQTKGELKIRDFISLPCDVERVAITYMYKKGRSFIPITRSAKIKNFLPLIKNTFMFDADEIVKQSKEKFSKFKLCNCMSFLFDLSPMIPKGYSKMSEEDKIEYVNKDIFRISVSSFLDFYNFDLKSMQKECVHFITPELKKIPFSSYNMFYRK